MEFTSAELTDMRTAQDGHMMDTCYLQTYSRTFNTFGEPVETWTDAENSTACGLEMKPGRELRMKDKTPVEYDAIIRLPIATVPDEKDRIKITKRFGETITPSLVFEIVAPIQRGPSGIRLLLRKIDV